MYRAHESRCRTSVRSGSRRTPPATQAPYFLKALREGLEEANAFELQRRLRRAVALEQRLDAQVGPLLRAVADSRLYRALGFTTLAAYARERLGMSPQRAQVFFIGPADALRLFRAVLCTVRRRMARETG